MKHTIRLCSVMLLGILLLAGCSKTQTKTYTGETKGVETELTYTYQDDEVIKASQKRTLNYNDLSVSKKKAMAILEPSQNKLKALEGVTAKIEYNDNEAVALVDIDYDEVDLKEVAKADSYTFLAKDEDYISMKNTDKNLKHSGYKEKKKTEKES